MLSRFANRFDQFLGYVGVLIIEVFDPFNFSAARCVNNGIDTL